MPALLADAGFPPFAVVVDSAIAGIAKPDPGIYRLAATEIGLPPTAILHVGDSWERDVVPARLVGMHTAWLARADAVTPPEPANVWRLDSLLDLGLLT
jgi:FMN hydrolase / 5-amino-6-(5-phospho-D-ribitylamino)uracil phosphatase